MTARDPVRSIREASRDARLPASVRKALAAAGDDGIRITALLVAKLRFERLLQGSPDAGAWFERAPAEFTAAFRRYHEEVPPTAGFPPQEAILFQAWLRRNNQID